eukprot:scaffold39361_cov57-Phaeocystis_antarctica.AAC.2
MRLGPTLLLLALLPALLVARKPPGTVAAAVSSDGHVEELRGKEKKKKKKAKKEKKPTSKLTIDVDDLEDRIHPAVPLERRQRQSRLVGAGYLQGHVHAARSHRDGCRREWRRLDNRAQAQVRAVPPRCAPARGDGQPAHPRCRGAAGQEEADGTGHAGQGRGAAEGAARLRPGRRRRPPLRGARGGAARPHRQHARRRPAAPLTPPPTPTRTLALTLIRTRTRILARAPTLTRRRAAPDPAGEPRLDAEARAAAARGRPRRGGGRGRPARHDGRRGQRAGAAADEEHGAARPPRDQRWRAVH